MNLFANFQTWSKQVVYTVKVHVYFEMTYFNSSLYHFPVKHTPRTILFHFSMAFDHSCWIVFHQCLFLFKGHFSVSALFSPFPFSLVVSIEGLGKWYYSLFCKMCPIHIHFFFWFFLCCKLAFIRENFIFAIYRW